MLFDYCTSLRRLNLMEEDDIILAGRIWNAMPVRDRVVLVRNTGKIGGHVGSAAWEKVEEKHRPVITEILVGEDDAQPDTDPDNRSIRLGWSEGKPVYRASMAGHCVKELWLWRTGIKPKDVTPGPKKPLSAGLLGAREGSLHESWIVEELEREDYQLTWVGENQRELEKRFRRFVVKAHPDGMVRGNELGDEWRVLECKALKQERFELWVRYGWDAFPNYAAQVSLEMYLSGAKAFYIVKNRNTGDMVKLKVDHFPIAPAVLLKKFASVEDLCEANNEVGPDCGAKAEWFFCPFFTLGKCDVLAKATPEDLEELKDPEFEELLQAYQVVKVSEKEVEEIKAGLRLKIEERMVKPKLRVGQFFVALSDRTRLSFRIPEAKDWIEDHGGDPAEFDRITEYTELRVKGEKQVPVEEIVEGD